MDIQPTHSYRAQLVPADMPASDVEAAADAGALPTLRLRAPNASRASAAARALSGKAVLRVERIDPPTPQSGKAQAATEIEAREVAA